MKPIYIHKTDSTIFADVKRFLTFNIETDLDLTGWSAKFILGWVEKTITDISSKSFELVLSAQDTSQLRLGSQNGSIILTDSDGNIKTVTNDIPFEVTTAVVENEYQEIDLTIPQSSGVDIKLKVGMDVVTSINGMTGEVYLDIPSIEGLATKKQLTDGLNAKQDKGDYALRSELPTVPTLISELENDSNFATQTQVMQAIASIPQFKLSIVDALPETGEKMTLYFVPKEGADNDVYNEYVWIEQTSSYEFLGSTAVDLTDYVKNTDFTTSSKAGIVAVNADYGTQIIDTQGLIGASIKTLELYNSAPSSLFIGKGTLENVLTQYKKMSEPITEAEYEALQEAGTVDANTLYLIEEE